VSIQKVIFNSLNANCKAAPDMTGLQKFSARALPMAFAVFLIVPTEAREREWITYENENFIGYSNATPAKALAHLVELEQIRAAVLQIISIELPASMPKTRVILFHSKKEFTKTSPVRHAAAFVTFSDGQPTMVMTLAGDRRWASAVIRHELMHVLVRAGRFEYPAWYEEGFAELASSIRIVDDGQAFVFGEATVRDSSGGPPIFDWDELVSDRFDTHSLGTARLGSSAYLQAWLLTHYVTLGENGEVAKILNRYLELMHGGATSTDAFESAFGMSAKELWLKKLRYYARELQVYQFKLQQRIVDTDFRQTAADRVVLNSLLDSF
jgi:hypothetical protein